MVVPIKFLNRKKLNPGELSFTGKHTDSEVELQLFCYNAGSYSEERDFNISGFEPFPTDDNIYWLNIHGIHNIDIVTQISSVLNIHQLVVQDIIDINQRPKFQQFDNFWFFTLKSAIALDGDIAIEQLSFIMGNNYMVSFQERKADYFGHIRERIRNKIGIVRERKTDYLLFLMLESILDNYFKTISEIESIIRDIKLIDDSADLSPETLVNIEKYKREVYRIKKTLFPIKDFISFMERENFSMIENSNTKYFLEIKDMCLTLIDECDQLEMRIESNVNLFFSVQGHRMNLVMKTLTVVATIFIPLTFVAGIYGMNFANIPELTWRWGYAGVWGVMLLMFAGMMYYFRKKRWF